jgi:prepilin-type N-terminal cleavage/methylation domain-containing protein
LKNSDGARASSRKICRLGASPALRPAGRDCRVACNRDTLSPADELGGYRETVMLRKGFTLLETVIVVAIIGIVLLLAIPALLGMFQSYKVKTAASQIAIHVRMARNLCVTQKVAYQVVIRSEDAFTNQNTYVVLNKPSFSYVPVPNLDTTFPSGVKIRSTSIFSSGVATLQFTPTGRIISSTGTSPYFIEIEGANQLQYRVTIDPTGSVEVREG